MRCPSVVVCPPAIQHAVLLLSPDPLPNAYYECNWNTTADVVYVYADL